MSVMSHSSVNPTPRSSTRDALQLTRDEVRVLQYYRALSADDREAVRCLLNALLIPHCNWPARRPRPHPQLLKTPVQAARQDNVPLPQSGYSQELCAVNGTELARTWTPESALYD